MVKYDDQYRHFGSFVVDKAYRGQGYGMRMTTEVLRRSEPNGIISLYSVPDRVEKYRKVLNTVPQWLMERHMVDIPKALPFLKDSISANARTTFSIKQVGAVDLKDLCDFDTKVFGYKREKFVERLLQTSHARVATDQQHAIVGYAVARVLYNQDGGYKAGPVFCESIEIAKCLLAEVFEDILQAGKSSRQAVTIEFSCGVNPAASELAEILHGKFLGKLTFASSNGLPKSDFKKWFAITNVATG